MNWYYVTIERPIPLLAYFLSLLGTTGVGIVLFNINRRYRPEAAKNTKLRHSRN